MIRAVTKSNDFRETPILFIDNQSTICLLEDHRYHFKVRHIDAKYNFVSKLYTERKTDPKSRYFMIFDSTFQKCLIQLSVELI